MLLSQLAQWIRYLLSCVNATQFDRLLVGTTELINISISCSLSFCGDEMISYSGDAEMLSGNFRAEF